MNNNNLDQISMRSSKRKRSRFNLKSVNDTSFSMGEIQPVLVKEVVPNSNSVLSVGNIVRLAPMNAPTFGQLKLHHNFSFVGMSDLTDKFSAFLANQPVAFGAGVTQVPKDLPFVSRDVLSAMILWGAKCSIYVPETSNNDVSNSYNVRRWYYNIDSSWTAGTDPVSKMITVYGSPAFFTGVFEEGLHGISSGQSVFTDSQLWTDNIATKDPSGHWQTAWKNYDGCGINLGRILGWSHDFWVPSANFSPYSFLSAGTPAVVGGDVAQQIRDSRFYDPVTMDLEDVSPDNADYTVYNKFAVSGGQEVSIVFCFRLSDVGKRIRKLLLACGYGVELNDELTNVSLMPLFAIYKAWFDSFGITLYQSWETTNCAKLLQYYDSDYLYNWSDVMKLADTTPPSAATVLARQIFVAFFADIADMWFTEEQDFISAHIRSAAVSPNDGVRAAFADSPNVNAGGINISDVGISSSEDSYVFPGPRHAYIDNVLHSQLDSEILKRLYKVTNRNTIAGRRIAELLKAQGLGEYMKRCRSRFIGHWACEVDVFDVTATADSMNTVDGKSSVLGEFVGKGVGNGKSKRFKYSTSEFGYIIDLAAIVPESGWTNGEDLSTRNIQKLNFYNPEYDGLGFELNPKSIVSSDVTSGSNYSSYRDILSTQSFGFVSRYTRFKVARNVLNGDFSRRGVRASFLPYSLDKYVAVGDRYTRVLVKATSSNAQETLTLFKCLSPSRVPISSPIYRYLARYPWMGNLLRIFTNIGRDKLANDPYVYLDYDTADGESVNAWYLLKTDDNFAVQNVFLYDYYAPMLPIEESFETHEDGNNGPSDMAMGKA